MIPYTYDVYVNIMDSFDSAVAAKDILEYASENEE